MRKPNVHYLKTLPEYYEKVESGSKLFEIRKDDREPRFEKHDWVVLQEFDPEKTPQFSGINTIARISFILRDAVLFGLRPGFCVFSMDSLHVRATNDGVEAFIKLLSNS